MKIEELPSIYDDDLANILADPDNPEVWADAIMNGLGLWHDADRSELLAYLVAMKTEMGKD